MGLECLSKRKYSWRLKLHGKDRREGKRNVGQQNNVFYKSCSALTFDLETWFKVIAHPLLKGTMYLLLDTVAYYGKKKQRSCYYKIKFINDK